MGAIKSICFILLTQFSSVYAISEKRTPDEFIGILSQSPLGLKVRVQVLNGYSWIEYCPENTCEVIRTKEEALDQKLAMLTAGYFLYVSKYIYLKKWQNDSNSKKLFLEFSQKYVTGDCKSLPHGKLIECVLKETADEIAAELLFIRYDEGRANIQKMNLSLEITERFRSDSIK